MAAKRWMLSDLWACQENAFGVEPDADGSDYKYIKTLADMTFDPDKEVIERDLSGTLARIPHVMGAKKGQLSWGAELKGSGVPGTAAVTASQLDTVLAAVFGTKVGGTGTTVNDPGATTSSFILTSVAGLTKGMMIIVNCGSDGYIPRFVTNIVGSTVTVDRPLPSAPANGAIVQATTAYKRTDTGHKSLAFAAKRDGILYTFLGCKLNKMTIDSIEANSVAKINFTFDVTDWNTNAKAQLVAPAIGNSPPVIKGACFAYGTVEELIYGMSVDFGLTFVYQDSTCSNGPNIADSINASMAFTMSRPVATVKAYYAAEYMVDFAAGTAKTINIATPNNDGSGFGIFIGTGQLTQVTNENRNGMIGTSISFAANDNGTEPDIVLSLA